MQIQCLKCSPIILHQILQDNASDLLVNNPILFDQLIEGALYSFFIPPKLCTAGWAFVLFLLNYVLSSAPRAK